MAFKYFFLLFVIFMFSAISVDALRCYVCQDITSGDCFDPEPNNVTSVVCEDSYEPNNHNQYVCYTILGTVGDTEIVERGCQIENQVELFCSIIALLGDVDCVYCKEDLCNS